MTVDRSAESLALESLVLRVQKIARWLAILALGLLSVAALPIASESGLTLGSTLRVVGVSCLLVSPWLWVVAFATSSLKRRRSGWFLLCAGLIVLAGLALL